MPNEYFNIPSHVRFLYYPMYVWYDVPTVGRHTNHDYYDAYGEQNKSNTESKVLRTMYVEATWY
jgi:hypothetical protein